MRVAILVGVLALGVAGEVRAQGGELNLRLLCQGQRVDAPSEAMVTAPNDHNASHDASARGPADRPSRIGGRIDVTVVGERVRINPASILHSSFGGEPKDGWYELSDVVIDQDQIAGTVRLSALQKPHVRIDRHTGAIHVGGTGMRFDGDCEKNTAPPLAQKF
jgi:hypothetical protein